MDAKYDSHFKRYDALRSQRASTFDPLWQTVSQYVLPQLSDINVSKTEGVTGWTDDIFDTTAIDANLSLAAGARNWLYTGKWFSYQPPPWMEDGKDEAALYYGKCTEIMLRLLAKSNFYTTKHSAELSWGGFGTSCLFCDESKRGPFYFGEYQVGTYVIAEDDEGYVDTVMREFEFTARQAAQKWGVASLTKKVKEAFESKNPTTADKKFKFLHCVYPRLKEEYDGKKLDPKNKPFANLYFCIDDQATVYEGGFDKMPYFVSRFMKWGKTPYGFSPSIVALPNIRQANFMCYWMDALAELKAEPRTLIPDTLVGEVDYRAGSETIVGSKTDPQAWPRVWMDGGDFDIGLKSIEMKREGINRAFYVPMFKMLEQSQFGKATATEIEERKSEQIEQFSPVFDRKIGEEFNPLHAYLFDFADRAGYFPSPPAAVQRQNKHGLSEVILPEVAYSSRLALRLNQLESQAFLQVVQVVGQIDQTRQGSPEQVSDNFEIDDGMRKFAMDGGLAPDLIKPIKKRDEMRAARKQQIVAAQQAQMAEKIATAAGKLGKAPPEMQQQVVDGLKKSAA